jgi:hypothetical protein
MGFSPSRGQEVVNILDNGGFEDGVVAPWSTYGGVSTEVVQDLVGAAVPEAPVEGDSCLHVVVPAAGTNFWDISLNQAGLVFEAGKKYTLSAFLKCDEGTLRINFKPELAQDPWTAPVVQAFVMTEEWAEYSVTTGVISEDISPAEIVLHIGYAPGDFWIDGVRFYEGDYVPANLRKGELASSPNPVDGGVHEDTWAALAGYRGILRPRTMCTSATILKMSATAPGARFWVSKAQRLLLSVFRDPLILTVLFQVLTTTGV